MFLRPALISLLLLFALHARGQNPFSLNIGTYAIDKYNLNAAPNGDAGMGNFTHMTSLAENFHLAAQSCLPINPPAGFGRVVIGPVMKFENTEVTRNAITDLVMGNGSHREDNKFVFYGGHGDDGSLFLGLGADYGYIHPADLNLGMANNAAGVPTARLGSVRWFWANSCLAFSTPGSPVNHWSPAFRGMKAMLGYGSLTFDYNNSFGVFKEFWQRWTHMGYSLFFAFYESQIKYEGITHKGIDLACISAPPAPGQNDYCRQSFQEVDTTAADISAAVAHSSVVGSPIYE